MCMILQLRLTKVKMSNLFKILIQHLILKKDASIINKMCPSMKLKGKSYTSIHKTMMKIQ